MTDTKDPALRLTKLRLLAASYSMIEETNAHLELDGEAPVGRYTAVTTNGMGDYNMFTSDNFASVADFLKSEISGEIAWSEVEVIDLDLDQTYRVDWIPQIAPCSATVKPSYTPGLQALNRDGDE